MFRLAPSDVTAFATGVEVQQVRTRSRFRASLLLAMLTTPTTCTGLHRYSLALAWQQGAQQWTEERREQFANAAEKTAGGKSRVSEATGTSGPGSWLPQHKS